MSNNKNLVFSPIASDSLHKEWILGHGSTFDLSLNIHDGSKHDKTGVSSIFRIKDHKWRTIDTLLKITDWMEQYDYFFFPDHDISMSTTTINALFYYARNHKLILCQPCLLSGSYGSHHHTYQQNKVGHRKVPFVEIMCPIMSRECIQKCQFTFSETESGWGLDIVWSSLLSGEGYVIDELPVMNTRPMFSDKWKLSNGMTPLEEARNMLKKYGLQ
jgi:hypothetical protein